MELVNVYGEVVQMKGLGLYAYLVITQTRLFVIAYSYRKAHLAVALAACTTA